VNRETAERCTILRGFVGLTAHGLNVNDGIEDRDEVGICVEPFEEAIALCAPFEQFIYRSAAEREGRENASLECFPKARRYRTRAGLWDRLPRARASATRHVRGRLNPKIV